MTILQVQLEKCNLSHESWDKLCKCSLERLQEKRGKLKTGQKYIFDYNGLPVIGVLSLIRYGKEIRCHAKFMSPLLQGQELYCNVSERDIKLTYSNQ